MNRQPTQLDHTRDILTRLANTNWKQLRPQILDTIRRGQIPPPELDGYPASPQYDNGTGQNNTHTTSVEAAAMARGTPPPPDPIKDHADAIYAHITEMAGHLAAIKQRLTLVTNLSTPPDNTNTCELCGAQDTGQLKLSDVAGNIKIPRHLCVDTAGRLSCYQVVYKNHGWPDQEQIDHHNRTGKWRYRTTGTTTKTRN